MGVDSFFKFYHFYLIDESKLAWLYKSFVTNTVIIFVEAKILFINKTNVIQCKKYCIYVDKKTLEKLCKNNFLTDL